LARLTNHGAMLLVRDVDERGEERIVVLPFGSVVSYFTGRDDAPGMTLHVQPGLCAFPAQFQEQFEGVRAAVLAEASRRMLVNPEEVLEQAFMRLVEVADRDFADQPQFFSRKRSKGGNRPFYR
jgi:hypothetical protein